MSSKSKRQPMRMSQNQIGCRYLLVSLWAWVSKAAPSPELVDEVAKEVYNVLDSLKSKNLTESQIVAQLEDEYGIHTDWARRDRS